MHNLWGISNGIHITQDILKLDTENITNAIIIKNRIKFHISVLRYEKVGSIDKITKAQLFLSKLGHIQDISQEITRRG